MRTNHFLRKYWSIILCTAIPRRKQTSPEVQGFSPFIRGRGTPEWLEVQKGLVVLWTGATRLHCEEERIDFEGSSPEGAGASC